MPMNLAVLLVLGAGVLPALFYDALGENNAKRSNIPPKIVTKDGTLILKAGDEGDIVFEPGVGRRVLIGGNALNLTAREGPKGAPGEPGKPGQPGVCQNVTGPRGKPGTPGVNGTCVAGQNVTGTKGAAGPPGVNGTDGSPGIQGQKGDQGPQGPPGQQGLKGSRGLPGINGLQGEVGPKGPPGKSGSSIQVANETSRSCNSKADIGALRFADESLQVCTGGGWRSLVFANQLCDAQTVPRRDLDLFTSSSFGLLLQFDGDLHRVSLSPKMNQSANITMVYQNRDASNATASYVNGIMGKAVFLKSKEYIDLHGIPARFWSGDEWSVMAWLKFNDHGLSSAKQVPVLGDGEAASGRGFHLGLEDQKVIHGFYSNDVFSKTVLEYDKWYHVVWTWIKTDHIRRIYINGKLDTEDKPNHPYTGVSGNTQIGTWWNDPVSFPNNLQLDTLFITNKALDVTASEYDRLLCLAKHFHSQMP